MTTNAHRSLLAALASGCCLMALSTAAAAQDAPAEENAGEVVVTGSRIPTIRDEGPTAVTVIDAESIRANGYTSVPELLASVTQNSGETQSPQSGASSDFTPGAQQVDLRGLGPNHTLVLVNGRRIADFPLPMSRGNSFTDISNIPVGLIERVEILSGAASAIYGSDAIAGVVNFKMKERLDGITLDYRHGRTEHGGGMSHRATVTAGWSTDRFSIVGGVEYLNQQPLWAYERQQQDSTQDHPNNPLARRVFYRADENVDYIPPPGNCASVAATNWGSTRLFNRRNYGPFCGSELSIGYGTIVSEREGFNSYGSLNYELSDNAKLFTDFQFGISNVKLMYDVTSWAFETSSSSADTYFFNSFTNQLEDWARQFSPEETGGFRMIRNKQTTYSITPGIRGQIGDKWNYEASFNYSRYQSVVRWPQVIAARANALFLGPQLGIDEDSGYPIFNANPTRLYTPLTVAEYDSISADTVYNPRSWASNLQAVINTTELFELPAGPIGFAAVAEYGKQGYDLRPDPLALTNYYYSWLDSDGKGSRDHAAAGGELRVPVFSFLSLSGAGRYDYFRFAGRSIDKFTYNVGAEFRPINSILARASYGTAFRAPDLHYLFSGPGNVEGSGVDYLTCRQENAGAGYADCEDYDVGFVQNRSGNRNLEPETGKTLTAGIVFSPSPRFFFSADYFNVTMDNQVANLSTDTLLRDEADCVLGRTPSGAAVDRSTGLCQDAIARITRFASGSSVGEVSNIRINPINVSREKVSGLDLAARVSVPTGIGTFKLSAGHTHVFKHTYQQYPGDPFLSKFVPENGFYTPRDKSNASFTWDAGQTQLTVSGTRLGKLTNWAEDGTIPEQYLFNATLQHDFTTHLRGSLTIRNLLDENPVKDPTHTSYPYYNASWYDTIGRSVFMQLTYKIGGKPL